MNPRRLLPAAAAVAAAGAAVMVANRPPAADGMLSVMFLDVGQGDAAVVRTPNGLTLAVDTGRSTTNSDLSRTVVAPHLRSLGVSRLDGLIVTHSDGDHAGGAETLLGLFSPKSLLLPAPMAGQPEDAAAAIAGHRKPDASVRVRWLSRGQTVQLGPKVRLQVLSPSTERADGDEATDNNRSLVLRLSYGVRSILMEADAEGEAERDMLMSGLPVRSDVLKVSHHGSRSASTEAWLTAVRPAYAVISVGRRNRYGHPHPTVLTALRRCGAQVYRTDRNGDIGLRTDGTRLTFTTQRGRASAGPTQ
ncbi:MAG: ComEC/Rec2 family competence protein [Armatimonadetes bacterium]|nr:ComEC/Rec2 family competence protein [Armatimonadota bacterium]